MESTPTGIEHIEKRLWQLVLLAVVVILYLTITLLGVHFLAFFGGMKTFVAAKSGYEYSVFLSILVLLFCAYIILQHRKLLRLSKELIVQKEEASRLGESVKILTALFEVSSSINSKEKLTDILNTITRKMITCFNADHSSIMLFDRRNNILKTMASFGKGSELAKNALIRLGKSVSGWVLKTGKPLLLNGEVDPADFPGFEKKQRRISSALCVPLKIGDSNIGVLNVNLIDKGESFSDSHLKLITIFANNAAVAINNAMLSKERVERVRLENMFKRLHSPEVAEDLVRMAEKWTKPYLMREKRKLSLVFADIRGFTDMVNVLELKNILNFLDEFYAVMTRAVADNEGNINKFIGDEIMAFFGAPKESENSVESAVKAAIEMMTLFNWAKEKYKKISPDFENLGLGVGIDSGEVVVGTVGSPARYDYTVIGNAVNLAKRLCSYAAPGQILITEHAIQEIHGMASSSLVGPVYFKGFKEPVIVHEIT